MKALIVLLMAATAIDAFFIGERSRDEFIDALHRFFLNMHHGQLPHAPPSLGLGEMERIRTRFESLTLEEQERLKNYLFGERFPKPMPAHHIEQHPHHEFNEEKLKEMREKWESMTPEEREEMIRNRRKEHEEIKIRSPRSIPPKRPTRPVEHDRNANTRPAPPSNDNFPVRSPRQFQPIRPLPEHERPAHHREHPHHEFSEEQLKEMRARWESMTPEEREEMIKNRRKGHKDIKIRSTRSIADTQDDRSANRRPAIRPAAQNDIYYDDLMKILDELSPEERSKFFKELFPNGMPIRPIGIVPAGKGLTPDIDNGRTRITEPWARDRVSGVPEINKKPERINRLPPRSSSSAKFQSIFPLEFQPIFPLETQPILPLPNFG